AGGYRQALARDPSLSDACYGLAQCLRALGQPKEAKDYEERAARIESDAEKLLRLRERMEKEPRNAELPCEAGRICLRNGQKAEAVRWFRNALQRDPSHEGARRGLEEAVRK